MIPVPNPRRFFPVLIVSAVLAGSLAACGGSSDEPAPAPAAAPEPAAMTKADLISQGDSICAEVNAAIGSIAESTTTAESDKASQVSELYGGLADRLEKLGTPDDGPPPTEVITALRELADDPEGDGEPAAFQEAAETYGFSSCAEGPAAPTSAGTDDGSGADGGVPAEPEPAAPETYEAPAPAPEPAPAPAPAPDTGGVNPDAPSPSPAPAPSNPGGTGGGIGPG